MSKTGDESAGGIRMMAFGTHEFCETLRRCRKAGLTLSQAQVLSLLAITPGSKSDLSRLTDMTLEGTRKSVQYLIETGDVDIIGEKIVKGRLVAVYGLSSRGRQIVERMKL